MKLGFNLLLWTTHVVGEHAPLLDRLKATGYDGVDIPLFEGDAAHYAKLGSRLKGAGLSSSAVTVMPSGRSAISSDAAQRQGALDHLIWAIDCSAELGADVLCGPFHQPLGEFSGKGPTDSEKAYCAEVHREAARYAAGRRIALSVEPLNRFEVLLPEHRARCSRAGEVRRRTQLRLPLRHIPLQYRREKPARRDPGDGRLHQPRPHLRERPRNPRHRADRFPGCVRGAEALWLRRLAHGGGLRLGAA